MIKGTFRNDIPANRIKNGTTELTVSISFDKNTIVAKRGKGSTTYTVNGQEYGKLAGSVPESVASMGYNSIQIGNVELDPIFGSQFDNQFLLSSSPSDLNTILGAFSSTEKLDQGKKKIGAKIREIDVEAKIVSNMVTESEAKKSRVQNFLNAATPIENQIIKLESESNTIQDSVSTLNNYIEIKRSYDNITEISRGIDNCDTDVSGLVQLEKAYSTLNGYRYSKYVVSVAEKSSAQIDYLVSELGSISDNSKAINSIGILLKSGSFLDPKALDTSGYESEYESVLDMQHVHTLISNIMDYDEILFRLESDKDSANSELTDLNTELTDLKKEQAREQASKTQCPECGFLF
jgi:hypothetical protein